MTPPDAESKFPSSFWSANLTELFERGAYYAMASFLVIYLGQLGFGDYWPSFLNSVLWGLVYFLPLVSGAIADHIGFRKSLLLSFIMVCGGYFAMGYPVWVGGSTLTGTAGKSFTASLDVIIPVALGILLIGVSGSFVKPCIAGTVQKTSGARKTLGFAIFYMIINIGSLFGRFVSYTVRRSEGFDLSSIFLVSLGASVIAFLTVLFFYKDPDADELRKEPKQSKSVKEILLGIVKVLSNRRFVTFLVIASGFNMIYSQVYNLLPLYTRKTVELTAAMDLYTAANPLIIVVFQLVITRAFGKLPAIKSITIGIITLAVAMLINIVPLYMAGGVTQVVGNLIPLGSLFIIMTVALIAFGELFKSGRLYEYIGSFAPKGQEGLFQGYAQLPMAIGVIVGGPVGALIFNEVMCHKATTLPSGLLVLDKTQATFGWLILAG
ncbi:MAG: MFS transporter, partial [Holophaga sp.]|nr:MFS transporter [Holophaga sp.]